MTGPLTPGSPATPPNTVPAVIRTVVPLVVGTVLAWLASRGFDLTQYENAVNVFLPPVLGSLYYAAIFALEKRFPAFGWLLGFAKQPTYIGPTGERVPAPDVEPRRVGGYTGGEQRYGGDRPY